MNREEVQLLGFEIVAFAGDARSKFLEALTAAQAGDFAKADALIEEGNNCIAEAHRAQTSLLAKEAQGDEYCIQCNDDAWSRSFNDNNFTERFNEAFIRIL